MPQMAPVWWFSLMMIFILLFFFTSCFVYFNFSISVEKSLNIDKNNFKWMW